MARPARGESPSTFTTRSMTTKSFVLCGERVEKGVLNTSTDHIYICADGERVPRAGFAVTVSFQASANRHVDQPVGSLLQRLGPDSNARLFSGVPELAVERCERDFRSNCLLPG